jgi:hypothetical protein
MVGISTESRGRTRRPERGCRRHTLGASLSEGLHVERTEFLMADQSKDGQELMLDYMETTDATGELPLYNPATYARALESGRVPGRRSTNR